MKLSPAQVRYINKRLKELSEEIAKKQDGYMRLIMRQETLRVALELHNIALKDEKSEQQVKAKKELPF